MTLRRRVVILTGLAAGGGAVGLFVFGARPADVTLTGAEAQPVAGRADEMRVFLSIHNAGGPDRLLSAELNGHPAEIVAQGDIVLPAGGQPVMAADGAHLRVHPMTPPGAGALLPLSLHFAQAGTVVTRARVTVPFAPGEAPDLGLLSLGGICRIGPGEPAPDLALSVKPEGDGWRVVARAGNFHFSEPTPGLGHVPGYGHGHLYLNGLKLSRMYDETARIGALPSGRYGVSVTLNTNDHRAYVVDDEPVHAFAQLVVS